MIDSENEEKNNFLKIKILRLSADEFLGDKYQFVLWRTILAV